MLNVCFWFGVYQEYNLAKRLITSLRSFYPKQQIICIADGSYNLNYATFCNRFEVIYLTEDRIKLQHYGGAWVERMFQSFLDRSSAEIMLRLEPDSFINYGFTTIPKTDVLGNILNTFDGRQYIHGGCIAFSRNAIKKILNSKLLKENKYKTELQFAYQRYKFPYLLCGEKNNEEWIIAEDLIWSDVIWQLGLNVTEWHEVYSRVRESCPEPKKYAVIHPVKI